MRLMNIIFLRLQAIMGKIWLVIFLFIAVFFSFFLVNRITSPTEITSLKMAVVDRDNSQLSNQIVDNLNALDGLTIQRADYLDAHLLLVRGQVEGIFIIDDGYEGIMMERDEQVLPIRYESVGTVATRTAAREIIAGQIITQRSLIRAKDELTDYGVNFSREELENMLALFNENTEPLYRFTVYTSEDTPQALGFAGIFTGYLGFITLVIILFMMTLSQWFAKPDSRIVATRMLILPKGRLLSFLGDTFLLLGVGIVIVLLAFLGSLSLTGLEFLYLLAYVYFITGLCLVLSRFQVAGSIDIMAPLIALFTSILGGAFMDLGGLSPVMRTLSLFTPQGQLLSGISNGVLLNLWVLLGGGTMLLAIVYSTQGIIRGKPKR